MNIKLDSVRTHLEAISLSFQNMFPFKMYDFKQITHCAVFLCSVKHAALLETNIDTGIIIGVQSKIARRITWETVDKNPIISSLNLKDLHANILFSRSQAPHDLKHHTFVSLQHSLMDSRPYLERHQFGAAPFKVQILSTKSAIKSMFHISSILRQLHKCTVVTKLGFRSR